MSTEGPTEQKRPPPKDGTSSTLVVRNIPPTTTSSDFNAFFSALAPVQHAFVVGKKEDSRVQRGGFGYVTFSDKADAVKLVSKSSVPWIDGKTSVTLAYAKPRQRHRPDEARPKPIQESKDPNIPSIRPRLIFRNLSWKVRSSEQLETVLAPYGKPKEVRIPRGTGGRMTGFAFVEMKTRKAAANVVEGVNGLEIEGRTVAVDWCVNKDEWTEHHKETLQATPADDEEPNKIDE